MGMMPAMARPSAVAAPHVAMHFYPSSAIATHSSSGVHVVSGTRLVRTRSGNLVLRPVRHTPGRSINSNRALLSQDVPGLGFDYVHLAAVHPQGNHFRGRNRGIVYAYFPFYGGGYYEPLSTDLVDEAPAYDAQQPQYAEPEPPQSASRLRPGDYPQNYAPQNSAQQPQPPSQRDSDEYVFVRRDGTVFFAVAYAWENGTLRYVTDEGVRHSLAGDKLDLDATLQFNEQRGLNFRSPA